MLTDFRTVLFRKNKFIKVVFEGVTRCLLLKPRGDGGAKFYPKTYKRCFIQSLAPLRKVSIH